jgi:hypothetical protein
LERLLAGGQQPVLEEVDEIEEEIDAGRDSRLPGVARPLELIGVIDELEK